MDNFPQGKYLVSVGKAKFVEGLLERVFIIAKSEIIKVSTTFLWDMWTIYVCPSFCPGGTTRLVRRTVRPDKSWVKGLSHGTCPDNILCPMGQHWTTLVFWKNSWDKYVLMSCCPGTSYRTCLNAWVYPVDRTPVLSLDPFLSHHKVLMSHTKISIFSLCWGQSIDSSIPSFLKVVEN